MIVVDGTSEDRLDVGTKIQPREFKDGGGACFGLARADEIGGRLPA